MMTKTVGTSYTTQGLMHRIFYQYKPNKEKRFRFHIYYIFFSINQMV